MGFTLIELLMTMFIMGILLAIAIPTYLGYAKRAQLSEAFSLTSMARRGVDEIWALDNRLASSNADAGVAEAQSFATDVVEQIAISDDGVITVTLTAAFSGGHLLLIPVPSGGILNWQCTSPDIRPSLLSRSCR
ncbi:MAG: pilin [Oceanococcus sp.]